ncbi:hypothetical protein [Psychrobacter sp. DAB_AL32B]|uniref:hypothetical protein n=1 Tax=Psychrobacter sp. DAB_AL32B TaxID=1028414 RepID=UPI000B7ED758|nr:hypothetical protein [Psychrobacter sp. DAB_AL32B]OXL23122.1 hypothetical protein CAN34_07900 [Psychrobacter sp. DAB_AL32B]
MNNELAGSGLTRALLARGDKQVWCAVDDDSDEQAMIDHCGNDFTACIVSFKDDLFYCSGGSPWLFAVPIKIVAVTQHEMNL